MEYKVGQKVRSIAGRDNGNLYVVLRTEGIYAYLSDGSSRKLDNTKKKKFKHIQGSYEVSDEIVERINDSTLENHMIRKFLNI